MYYLSSDLDNKQTRVNKDRARHEFASTLQGLVITSNENRIYKKNLNDNLIDWHNMKNWLMKEDMVKKEKCFRTTRLHIA